MKGKAIVKIVICSVVALVLIGILAGALVTKDVFTSLGDVSDAFPLVVSLGEYYNDAEYAAGEKGTDDHAETQVTGAVREIEIHWASGSVSVKPYEGDTIVLRETTMSREADRLRWKLRDGKLEIRERKSGAVTKSLRKTLEILLPVALADSLEKVELDLTSAEAYAEHLAVREMELDTASGNITLTKCSIGKLDVDSASGSCTAEGCTIEEVSMDSASGNANITGSIRRVNMDTASGRLTLVSDITPQKIEVDAVSGDCDLTIPADAGFTLKQDGVSSRLNIEGFAFRKQDKEYVCGDGAAEFSVEAVSGDVTIRAAN